MSDKKPYNNEPTDKYYCKYCDKIFGVKGFSTHLKQHSITFHDYIKENLELFTRWHLCPVCNLNICNTNNGKWPGTCSRECRGKLQSETQTGRIGWSRGLTKETHSGLMSVSIKASQRNAGLSPHRFWSDDIKEISRKKLSEHGKRRMQGEGNPMFGKTHTSEAIQKILTKRPKTKLEQIFSEFLDNHQIEYYFQFFINDESTHSYDFKIKGIPLIIETDGDYWHGGPGCKKHFYNVEECKKTDELKAFVANKHNYELIRIWESEIKTNFEDVKNKILNKIAEMYNSH